MLRIFQVFDSYLFGLMLIAQPTKNIRFEIPLDSSVIYIVAQTSTRSVRNRYTYRARGAN